MTKSNKLFDFSQIDPHDGFKIVSTTVGNEVSLHLTFVANNEWLKLSYKDDTKELIKWHDVSPVSLGEAARLETCLTAVARYLTMGGDLPRLIDILETVEWYVDDILYVGWHYHSGETLYD